MDTPAPHRRGAVAGRGSSVPHTGPRSPRTGPSPGTARAFIPPQKRTVHKSVFLQIFLITHRFQVREDVAQHPTEKGGGPGQEPLSFAPRAGRRGPARPGLASARRRDSHAAPQPVWAGGDGQFCPRRRLDFPSNGQSRRWRLSAGELVTCSCLLWTCTSVSWKRATSIRPSLHLSPRQGQSEGLGRPGREALWEAPRVCRALARPASSPSHLRCTRHSESQRLF